MLEVDGRTQRQLGHEGTWPELEGDELTLHYQPKIDLPDLKDLCGKRVAVEAETTQVDLLARMQRNCAHVGIQVHTFSTNSDALVELRTGRAAAVLNDLPPAIFLTNDGQTRAQYQLASTTQYEPAPTGTAVAKDQQQLRDAVQGALQRTLMSGDHNDIMTRWNVRSGALDQITFNSGR